MTNDISPLREVDQMNSKSRAAKPPIPNEFQIPIDSVTHALVSTKVSNHQSPLESLNEMMENAGTNDHGAAIAAMAVANVNVDTMSVGVPDPVDVNVNVNLPSHHHDQLVAVTGVQVLVPVPASVSLVPVPAIDTQNLVVALTENSTGLVPHVQEHHVHQSYEMVQVQAVEEAVNHVDTQEHEHEMEGRIERHEMNEVEQVVLGTFESVKTDEANDIDTLEVLKNTPLASTSEEFDKKYPAEIELMPASGIPIENPSPNDILFGRGGLTNHHPGNKVYRSLIATHKPDYQNAAKIVKPRVARRIIHAIRHSQLGARFLRRDAADGMWKDVGDKIASEKTSQALREKSAEEKKAQAKAKTDEDTVAAGYSMPSLSTNGTLLVAQTPQMAATDPAFATAAGSQEEIQEGVAVVEYVAQGAEVEQPPPVIAYPVEGGTFGTVNAEGHIVVTDQDILCGRGGATNHHKGNKRFRDIVALHRPDYVAATKIRKPDVARKIVRAIRMANPPGRFLRKGDDGKWIDVGDKKAAEKASQALREKGPEARKAAKTAATNTAVAGIDVNQPTEVQHYPTFPDVGAGAHVGPQEIAHSPFSFNVATTPGTMTIESESKEDLLPDIASGLMSDGKRHAERELEIVSPDPKRLRASPGESSPEEVHV